ncbi:MAG: helix-turn-helix transcriptional regulator [Clostridiales bacterium]|nr:helix-turn-helix transcriptional regulator [Clostridiales bacterium]
MYNIDKLGSKITAARKALGLTQEQLAKELSVTAQAVSKWESGAGFPDISLIPEIAQILQIPIDHLFGYCNGFDETYQGLPFITSFGKTACYSDKEVDVIYPDGIVYFKDRSAANIPSLTVDNYGKGEIRFCTKETFGRSFKNDKTGEYKYICSGIEWLELTVYEADEIHIFHSEDENTHIMAYGSECFTSSIRSSNDRNKLCLTQEANAIQKGTEPNRIEIYTPSAPQLLTLNLYGDTNVMVECDFAELGVSVYNKAEIHCQNTGLLGIYAPGTCYFTCARADGANIEINGAATIEIEEPHKYVHLTSSGDCNVNLGNAHIDYLETNLSGTGILNAPDLTVQNAKLCAQNQNDIILGRIVEYSYEALRNNAQLSVRHRGWNEND